MTDPSTVSADVPRGAPAETDTESDPGTRRSQGTDPHPGPVIGTIRATSRPTPDEAPRADTAPLPRPPSDAPRAPSDETTVLTAAAPAAKPTTRGEPPAEIASATPAPDGHPEPIAGPNTGPAHRRRAGRWRRALTVVLVIALLVATGAAVYLYRTSQAWQERAEAYLAAGQDVGADLAARQAELAGLESELEAVRAQLATAQDRIIELANEKAAAADDREAQRQVADYQERVSVAAGQVAFALDQCVQGQNQLIAFLESQIEAAETGEELLPNQEAIDQVHELCEGAREANIALQSELAR